MFVLKDICLFLNTMKCFLKKVCYEKNIFIKVIW